MELSETDISRFLSKINRNGPTITYAGTPCWLWTSGKSNGYGRFKVKRVTYNAHRISYHLYVGLQPSGLFVCHKCDNRKCVNPEHLFLGTTQDNTKDMVNKGRTHHPFGHKRVVGKNNGRAKLTEEQVLEIRADNRTQDELAELYGVTQAQISYIKNKKSWSHI